MKAQRGNFKEKTLLPDEETDQEVIQTEDIGSQAEKSDQNFHVTDIYSDLLT